MNSTNPLGMPAGFRPAASPTGAYFCVPPNLKRRRYTGRRLAGIRYERKVHEYLHSFYGEHYIESPWIRFFDEGKWRWCQPDGLILDLARGVINIVEVKYQHVELAWWQTRKLYAPVLRTMFPAGLWAIEVCEVVKWYDPAVVLPERVILASDVDIPHSGFKVHIWKP